MTIVVASDGSGNFRSVQEAVDAVPAVRHEEVTILLRRGTYRERVIVHRDCIRLIGEDRERTVITASACAKDRSGDGQERGTFLSATLLTSGRGVIVDNLTVRNDAGDGRIAGQAVAVYAAGDGGVWRSVNMIAHQDTLFCGPLNPKVSSFIEPRQGSAEYVQAENLGSCPETRSRQYFENCLIRGDVDFIFGPYRCLFDRCTLFMNSRGGFYTAANTPQEQPVGMVFRNCRLTGECAEGQGFLGRPWRKYARTVFLYCDMDGHVSPQGFSDWDEERVVTERCGEYGTTGERSDLSLRHPAEKRLTAQEAKELEKLTEKTMHFSCSALPFSQRR